MQKRPLIGRSTDARQLWLSLLNCMCSEEMLTRYL